VFTSWNLHPAASSNKKQQCSRCRGDERESDLSLGVRSAPRLSVLSVAVKMVPSTVSSQACPTFSHSTYLATSFTATKLSTSCAGTESSSCTSYSNDKPLDSFWQNASKMTCVSYEASFHASAICSCKDSCSPCTSCRAHARDWLTLTCKKRASHDGTSPMPTET